MVHRAVKQKAHDKELKKVMKKEPVKREFMGRGYNTHSIGAKLKVETEDVNITLRIVSARDIMMRKMERRVERHGNVNLDVKTK